MHEIVITLAASLVVVGGGVCYYIKCCNDNMVKQIADMDSRYVRLVDN